MENSSSPTPTMLTTEPPLGTPVMDITSSVDSGSFDTSINYLPSTKVLPAAVATIIIIASMLMLIAGFKLCEYRRVRRMRSNIPKSKNYLDSFSRLHKYRDCGIEGKSQRRRENETHRNEQYTLSENETTITSESSDEMEGKETERNTSCHETVEVEVHQYSSSDHDESSSSLDLCKYLSTPSPQSQQTLPKHLKPLRVTLIAKDVLYNIA